MYIYLLHNLEYKTFKSHKNNKNTLLLVILYSHFHFSVNRYEWLRSKNVKPLNDCNFPFFCILSWSKNYVNVDNVALVCYSFQWTMKFFIHPREKAVQKKKVAVSCFCPNKTQSFISTYMSVPHSSSCVVPQISHNQF